MTHLSKNWTIKKQRECQRRCNRKLGPKTDKKLWAQGKKFWQKNPLLYHYYMKGYHAASRR